MIIDSHSFGLIQFLFLSSSLILEPEIIFFHTLKEPVGFWWEEVKNKINKSKTKLEIIIVRDVKETFGNEVKHYAHKADVVRLEALKYYGGVYLDLDVIVIKG